MKRVLIVDDSKSVRNAASKMLANEFDVATAEDGDEAWSILGFDATIQVVFTDLHMPNRNGYELIRSIRSAADARLRALPVIVVTGVDQDEVARARSLELGATDFITKPFSSIDLLARARAHANYQEVTQELRARTTVEPLTGLANGAGFLARLQQDMAYAQRHDQQLSLVVLEIDNFRTFYLRHGKALAERLLVEFGRYLGESIRKEDTAGRVSLGEFALSLPGGEPGGVERLIDKAGRELLAIWSRVGGAGAPIGFRKGLIQPHAEGRTNAQEALDACRARLAITRHEASPPSASAVDNVAERAVDAAPAPTAPAAPASAAAVPATSVAATLQVDPLLAAIDRGDIEPVRKELGLVIRRLIPLFRILSPAQRAQLIGFLQRLGA